MAIYSNGYSRTQDISRGLQDVLRKNGMQAHITMDSVGNFQMVVLGHDSPAVTYKLTNQQAKQLMEWGTTSRNSKAYRTFVNIVKQDFDVPTSEVVAFNAGGRVNIGQYGYQVRPGEYGIGHPYIPFHRGMRGWGGDFLGWRPYHSRVMERPDGSIRPGEVASTRILSNGRGKATSTGFFYKGSNNPPNRVSQEIVDCLQIEDKIELVEAEIREHGKAQSYSDLIESPAYFNDEKWQEVLKSHGIEIQDAVEGKHGKCVVQMFGNTRWNSRYDLTDEEYRQLTAPHLDGRQGVSLEKRLKILNDVFALDFDTAQHPITKEMLDGKELVQVAYLPGAMEEVENVLVQQEKMLAEQQQLKAGRQAIALEKERIKRDPNAIDGQDIGKLLGNYGWYTSTAHGRGLVVGEIRVEKTAGDHYLMSAEINGHLVTHAISQKDYERFLALDDAHRLQLFNKVFKEVKIRKGFNQTTENVIMTNGRMANTKDIEIKNDVSASVSGESLENLNARKGFYREIEHGREVEVGEIKVEPQETQGKYKMTAVIDGQSYSHEISQKEYDKFLAVDDYHRMKMFAKIFDEVDMKTRPGQGANVGAAILAALVVGTDTLHYGMEMLAGPPHRPMPEVYASHYVKPGVASGLSAANFEQMISQNPELNTGLGRGR